MKIWTRFVTVPQLGLCKVLQDYVLVSLVLLRYLLIKNHKDTLICGLSVDIQECL